MTHLNDSQINRLISGQIAPDEKQELLEHIGSCDICSEKLADSTLCACVLIPPEGMYEQVLSAAAKEKSDRRKKSEILFLYSMRVIAGVCAAIVLMYTGMFEKIVNFNYDMTKVNDVSYSISEHLQNNLNKFSDAIFKLEVKD